MKTRETDLLRNMFQLWAAAAYFACCSFFFTQQSNRHYMRQESFGDSIAIQFAFLQYVSINDKCRHFLLSFF